MTKCQVCGRLGQEEGDVCSYCGATVRSVLGRGQPLPAEVAREFEEEKRRRESSYAERRASQLKRHATAGALVFCAFGVLMTLAQIVISVFAAASQAASAGWLAKLLLLSVLLIPVYGAVLGAPMGLIVGKWRLGIVGAGLLGASAFVLFYFALGMRFMFGPVQTFVTALMMAPFGFTYGGILSVAVDIDSEV